ncbi:MAG: Nicotinate-nucleotide adenylyltransferase [Phycisphaerae bacterium]|nr:Nicotinate-nucleotide adenylyltransferase [Phycisphaerae bacterium]
MQRIGLFGGSFNPIHFGHLIPAQAAAEQLGLEKLVLVPSANPPHKLDEAQHRNLASADHRLEMARRAVSGHPLFEVSDVELRRSGPSYTIDTIVAFREQHGLEAVLHWLIGCDSLGDIGLWHRAPELIDACSVVTMARPGWTVDASLSRLRDRLDEGRIERLRAGVLATPEIEISATQIRRRVAEGKSIRYLLPSIVARYIADNRLYVRSGG